MSNFTFSCPHCGNPLEAQEEWRGQQTNCPYCSQTITVPTAITLKKPNIAKRAIPQSKNFIRNNKKRIVAVSLGIICGLVVTFLIVYKMNKEAKETRWCQNRMSELSVELNGKTSGFLDSFNNIYYSYRQCPSGESFIIHLDNKIKIHEISPGAVVVECPKHRSHTIKKNEEIHCFYSDFGE